MNSESKMLLTAIVCAVVSYYLVAFANITNPSLPMTGVQIWTVASSILLALFGLSAAVAYLVRYVIR